MHLSPINRLGPSTRNSCTRAHVNLHIIASTQRFSSISFVAYAQRNVTATGAHLKDKNHTFRITAYIARALEQREQRPIATCSCPREGGEGTSDRFLNTASYEARNTSFQSLVLPLCMHISTGASGGVHRSLIHWLALLAGCDCRTTFFPFLRSVRRGPPLRAGQGTLWIICDPFKHLAITGMPISYLDPCCRFHSWEAGVKASM
jgi:hypothetical protein